jgi:hypothetical protein
MVYCVAEANNYKDANPSGRIITVIEINNNSDNEVKEFVDFVEAKIIFNEEGFFACFFFFFLKMEKKKQRL